MIKIGVDWGKTNIRIAASDDSGKIHAFQKLETQLLPETWELFLHFLEQLISKFLISGKIEWRNIAQIVAGVAGVRTHFEPCDAKIFGVPIVIDNDVMMIAKTIPLKNAILCYAGTGAITIFPRNGNLHVFGGEGQFLGDPGSGYHLGQSIVRTALRRFALTEKSSPTLKKLYQILNAESPNEILLRILEAENQIRAIAGFVQKVGWEFIDERSILEVVDAWQQVIEQFEEESVILAGGIFTAGNRICKLLQKRLPQREFSILQIEPAKLFTAYDFSAKKHQIPIDKILKKINA